jgi:ABC-type antimicrobial peptide transport system permease subunit|nr:ABC transporter permease [Kofleriaceae bacterium]
MVYARLATLEAARALARYRLRSTLAALGVAVAVATVVWVAAIGQAAIDASLSQLDALGDNLIWSPDYAAIKKWDVSAGEFFGGDDVEHARTVIVIGQTVKTSLFGDDPAVGEPLRIGGSWFTVIGVLAAKGQSPTGNDQDDVVMMPWTTAMRRILGTSQTWLDDIVCSAASPEDMAIATGQIVSMLRERHHIRVDGDDDFNVRKPQDLLEARVSTSRTLRLLMVVLAALALFVGGVGIMNVMLASVAQRTREIGVRMAIGARAGAIRVQFLGEAAQIAIAGATVGLAIGELGRGWVERAIGWPMHADATTGAIAAIATLAMGVTFGFYPALRASSLDPIAALRDDR